MMVLDLEGIEVDHCPTCAGTWLDAGELELIATRAGLQADPIVLAIRAAGDGERSGRRCPRCRRRMQTIGVGIPAAVKLDVCRRGHGLWFDAGELRALIAHHTTTRPSAVAPFLADLFRAEMAPTS